jgi:hypothetical protein
VSPGNGFFLSSVVLIRCAVGLWINLLSPTLNSQVPRGVLSLTGAGASVRDTVLDNPDVTGVVIRQDWSELEPSEGDFDWTFLDFEVERATESGKVILLRINTQANKPQWVTDAVTEAGGIFFTFDDDGVEKSIPVFWDPTYLAKKKAMITALGEHLTDRSNLKVVSASFANATSEDWSFPHMPDEIAEWFALGYTPEKMLNAGKEILDTTLGAFPNQYVTLAIAGDGNLNPTPTYLAENAIAEARATWPGRLIVQINSLSTFNPIAPGPEESVWNLLWNSQPDVAAQMLGNVFGDLTYRVNGGIEGDFSAVLTASVNAGASYGVNYIEIYQTDVIDLPEVVTYAHDLLVPPASSEFGNLSTRLRVGTGDNVLIGGVILTGPVAKKIIVRAIGPSLGIDDVLDDPTLELYDSSSQSVATNDDWAESELTQKQEILQSGFAPPDEREPAIVMTLKPGLYTAIARGAGGTTGIALIEFYDLDAPNGSRLANISSRGLVGSGDDVMIGGLIIAGDAAGEVIIRALGPSLLLPGTLADPALELYDQDGIIIVSNDNWRTDDEAEIIASGFAPASDVEPAIRAILQPVPYTAIVRGVNNMTGLALLECYQLDPSIEY